MLRSLYHKLDDHRHGIFGLLYLGFMVYAWGATEEIFALAATLWMNIFNFDPFTTWEGIWEYFVNLRTGVPPAISALEVICYKLVGTYNPITRQFYRFALILMIMLPLAFTKRTLRDYVLHFGLSWIMLWALVKIVMGNPQIYDVLLPVFVMLFLWYLQRAEQNDHRRGWQMWLMGMSGFFLSMAELSRPFMIALVPILIGIVLYRFRKSPYTFIPFLLPILLLSGGWHTKLLVQHGQVIWSNHSGANLVGAWAPLLDHQTLEASLEPEEPPLIVNQWTWDNINTDVHSRNTAKQKAAVFAAISAQPGKAWDRFLDKFDTFTEPQVGMYSYEPEGRDIDAYRWIIHLGFWILGFLILRAVWMLVKDWRYLFSTEAMLIGITAFLTLMPVIGESGEEARFLVSVVPLLMWMWLRGAELVVGIFYGTKHS